MCREVRYNLPDTGNHQAPGYSIVVSDGSQATAPSPALIDFMGAPTLIETPVTVTPGGATTLTESNLNVTTTDGSSPSQITFSVNDVQHSQFILNTTGVTVSNFTQSQLIDRNVQLIQDNSNIAPSYSVLVTSSNGISSAPVPVSVQLCNSLTSSLECAPRIVRNNLWIKQGTPVTLTSQNLYATDSLGQPLADDAVFYVTNMNHGHFDVNGSLTSFFTEQQLQSGVVEFIDDGVGIAPSYEISVQEYNLQTNSLSQVTLSLVNKPPYLSGTLPNQIGVVGQPFSLTIAPNTFVDPQNDPLTLSVGLYNSTQSLPDWLSFHSGSNRLSGIPTQPDVFNIGVTAVDLEGLSTIADFSLTILARASIDDGSLKTKIVSSAVSGVIGLFFLLLKIGLQHAAHKKLEKTLGHDKYARDVVGPVAKAIARRVKITGCMDYTTDQDMSAYKDAVCILLGALSLRGVDLEFSKMSETRRGHIISEIATQTRRCFFQRSRIAVHVFANRLISFFKAEVTPDSIRAEAPKIAAAVAEALNGHTSTVTQMSLLSNLNPRSDSDAPSTPSVVVPEEKGVSLVLQ